MAVTKPWSNRLRDADGRLARDVAYDYKRAAGEYVRSLREKRGMTQAEMATAVDMYFTMVSAIENGRNAVPPERLEKFSEVLRVPYREFCKNLLRWYNPWMYKGLFGADPALEQDLRAIPDRIVKTRNRPEMRE